jgi:hypothetical protein
MAAPSIATRNPEYQQGSRVKEKPKADTGIIDVRDFVPKCLAGTCGRQERKILCIIDDRHPAYAEMLAGLYAQGE